MWEMLWRRRDNEPIVLYLKQTRDDDHGCEMCKSDQRNSGHKVLDRSCRDERRTGGFFRRVMQGLFQRWNLCWSYAHSGVKRSYAMSKYGPRKPGSSSSALNVRLSSTYDMCAAQPERCQSWEYWRSLGTTQLSAASLRRNWNRWKSGTWTNLLGFLVEAVYVRLLEGLVHKGLWRQSFDVASRAREAFSLGLCGLPSSTEVKESPVC